MNYTISGKVFQFANEEVDKVIDFIFKAIHDLEEEGLKPNEILIYIPTYFLDILKHYQSGRIFFHVNSLESAGYIIVDNYRNTVVIIDAQPSTFAVFKNTLEYDLNGIGIIVEE